MAAFSAAIGLAYAKETTALAAWPLATAALWLALALALLSVLPGLIRRHPRVALALLVGALAADLAWNNGPNESTALPPSTYEVLLPDEPQRDPAHPAREARARQPRPGRARRARLPLAECQPRPPAAQHARLQSPAARPLHPGDRRRGPRGPAGSAALLAALPLLSLDARRSPGAPPHRDGRAGGDDRSPSRTRRPDARGADARRIRLREPAGLSARLLRHGGRGGRSRGAPARAGAGRTWICAAPSCSSKPPPEGLRALPPSSRPARGGDPLLPQYRRRHRRDDGRRRLSRPQRSLSSLVGRPRSTATKPRSCRPTSSSARWRSRPARIASASSSARSSAPGGRRSAAGPFSPGLFP